MKASREVNKIPLPPLRPASGLRIPQEGPNFLHTNYRLGNDLVKVKLKNAIVKCVLYTFFNHIH